MMQLVWRSVSFNSVLLGYVVAMAAVAWAIYTVDGAPQMYDLIYLPALFAMTIEVERLMRIMFVQVGGHRQTALFATRPPCPTLKC